MTKSVNGQRLVVVDLDGTITKSDTLIPFLTGCFLRHPRFRLRLLALPLDILAFAVGRFDTTEFKERLLTAFIGGLPAGLVDSWAREFASRIVDSGCRPAILSFIRQALERENRLVVLSASPEIYVRAIAQNLGITETIATRVEVHSGRYTGKLLGTNCKGQEKLRRLKEYLETHRYEGLTMAIGNEESDLAVLEWANEGWMVRDGRMSLRHFTNSENILC